MIDFLRKILDLARPYRFRLAWGIIFGILAGLLEPLMLLTVVFVYAIIFQDPEKLTSQSLWKSAPDWIQERLTELIQASSGNPSWQLSLFLVGSIPFVFLLRGFAGYLNAYFLQWVSIRAIIDLRVRLFSHLITLPAKFFSASRSADLISRTLSDTELIRATIGNSLATMIKDPVTVIVTLIILFWREPMLTTMAFIILPVCIVPISIYGRKARRASAATQQLTADLANSMIETFSGIRIVKAYNLENAVAKNFRDMAAKYVSAFMRMIRSAEAPGPLLEFAGSIGVAILLAYALVQPAPSRPDGDAFLLLVLGVITMYRPIKSIVRLHSTLEQARAAADRVFEALATQNDLLEPKNPTPLSAPGADIHFDNINFAYAEKPVLRDIQLTVKAGKLFALVGASGSGKTTLTNLLLRFYDPDSGAVRIGGTDIREVTTRTLRDNIAVVTQEAILFNESIRANIAIGRPTATEEEIIAAAKHAHAHDFIIEKPQGYDTIVGERGVELSGGQRQRIAIARALLRNAPILILDEATSALDNEAERIVQSALEELMVGRTTICIAHRLSTIQKADMIVTMHEGRIVETGTHAELLAKQGVYHKLHQLSINA